MHAEVVDVVRLTPRMVRVIVGGSGLNDFVPTPFADQYVNVLFAPKDASYTVPFDPHEIARLYPDERPIGRRYTIRSWDPDDRVAAIDFVVHGDVGTAGTWANRAEPGDVMQFIGPSGNYSPDPTADWHLLVGDESATPAIAAALEQLDSSAHAVVMLLADNAEHELQLETKAHLDLEWVHRDQDPGNHLLLPDAVAARRFPQGRVHAFVHGEASEVRAIRKNLLGERNIPKEHTSISPYWRREHTDEQWREVKRDWLAEVELDV